MKLSMRLSDVLANCSTKKVDKECIEHMKNILSEKNKKREDQRKELFEFMANTIYEDLERDILKISISNLEEKKKKILFHNLRKLFKILIHFEQDNADLDVLSDFLFYLFKYMRRLNVKKCYKVVKKVTKGDISPSGKADNADDVNADNADDVDAENADQVEKVDSVNQAEHVGRAKKTPFRMMPFLLRSNILIYLEILKREDSKNLLPDEHYFYQTVKSTMMSKKYILMLSQVVGNAVTSFPNFPYFIDTTFNLFLYVKNSLVPFFLKNMYKRITDVFHLKQKEMNTKFTVKKYYGFLFYVYFLYKLKIITFLHLNPSTTCGLLNDSVQLRAILDLYSHVLKDYRNVLHLCFTVISNKKNNKTVMNTFCFAIIYLVNLLHANHNDIMDAFPDSAKNNSPLFKKYKDVFSMYHKVFDALFKLNEEPAFSLSKVKLAVLGNLSSGRFNNHFLSKREKQRKEKWAHRQNYATKEGETRDGQNAHRNNADQNEEDSHRSNLHRGANHLITEWLAKKKGHLSKQELVQLTYRTLTEHDYSCYIVFSFLNMLTRKFIRLYDFPPILHDIVFYKPFRISEIIREDSVTRNKQSGKSIKNDRNIVSAQKIPTTELSNILYNNAFLNLLKDKLCLYLNIDGNILNLFFINELYKFVNNKDLNYKNLHYLLAHDTGTTYHRMNVLFLLQKIVLRNVLRYALSLGDEEKNQQRINDQNNDQENDQDRVGDRVDTAHMHTGKPNQLTLLFDKQNKKLKMLNMNEFALGTKELKAAAEKKEENTFTILKSIDFVDMNGNTQKRNLQFDMNIINIAVNQLNRESFTILKSLISLQNKNKDHTKMYLKNLRSLEILLKCTYNFVNKFLAIIHLTKSGEKCILCCNGKRQNILCTENYYEKVKNKKKKIKTTESEVYLQFEPTFGKICAKRNNFLVVKRIIKLCVSIMKKGKEDLAEDKQKRRHCNVQTVELSKVIIFLFNLLIFHMTHTLSNAVQKKGNDSKVNRKKLQKRYRKIFLDANALVKMANVHDFRGPLSDDLKKQMIIFSKNYVPLSKLLSCSAYKNEFLLFATHSFLPENRRKSLKFSRRMHRRLKEVSPRDMIEEGPTGNEEDGDRKDGPTDGPTDGLTDDQTDHQPDNQAENQPDDRTDDRTEDPREGRDEQTDDPNEERDDQSDIVVTNNFLLDILAEDPKKEEKKKKQKSENLAEKKERTDLFYDIMYLLKHLKGNLKEQSAEDTVRTLCYVALSLAVISRKMKMSARLCEQLGGGSDEGSGEEGTDEEDDEAAEEKTDEKEEEKTDEKDEEKTDERVEEKTDEEVEEVAEKVVRDTPQENAEEDSEEITDEEGATEEADAAQPSRDGEALPQSRPAMYAADLRTLDKQIKHIMMSFKVKKDIVAHDRNRLIELIKNGVVKIVKIIIKETKNTELLKIMIKCLEHYNMIESRITRKSHIVINYLLEFLKIIFFFPQLRNCYSRYLSIFFKSAFVRYLNISELFNGMYKKHFANIINKFASDFDVTFYLNGQVKTEIIQLEEREFISRQLMAIFQHCNKKKVNRVMRDDICNDYISNLLRQGITNEKSLLNTFSLNELSHLVQHICIYLNKILASNNAYLFNKKVTLNLLGLLKKIKAIKNMQGDHNLILFKDKLVHTHMEEVRKFLTLLDERIDSHNIQININEFHKRLTSILQDGTRPNGVKRPNGSEALPGGKRVRSG
ncbi:conserved Plasmodium protein, unknown function [Plasmodium knowlesi strain H]|uniref:Uncharacterized protein n=3 Tax=Plasmodium knowlesi TaxID=5850 RepID=A0A5K1VA06_PLAKH|nr:conserved Plasmodium protein, unknown function [Plasmodium knowlesi strain H]OTN63953.1 Uncharacterized protein PKNOH_S140275400 [Plasmodium knowlesi]CAA9991166.1 conserved Plasmodium protein, unknown function [Plasmodium knowlesi strain H]SBO27138.1 conserved Plasmodium protein, unknown function [Plasmodium knowlesi strain H]SBO29373.1 conserved Plasmodium protein, unknown function [Plasmodium knowlesi strain H]VVS80640.1 conserved Plasmodium protein, unknown function [Plasmodium knowlesi |eukprot:XP_002262458.1 hypothetical protein, conserved in Plasmodium species [Plasmodium knowlesi strain H]